MNDEERKARKSEKIQIIILTMFLVFIIILFTALLLDKERIREPEEFDELKDEVFQLCRNQTPSYDYELVGAQVIERSNMVYCYYYSQNFNNTRVVSVKIV